jgi:hypothetical protein
LPSFPLLLECAAEISAVLDHTEPYAQWGAARRLRLSYSPTDTVAGLCYGSISVLLVRDENVLVTAGAVKRLSCGTRPRIFSPRSICPRCMRIVGGMSDSTRGTLCPTLTNANVES